jgi:phosphoesterase RecJ-like protein
LTGLVTDTLGFRTSNTSAEVLEAAMVLQRSGASVAEIAGQTVGRMPLTTLYLWGRVLQSAQFAEGVLWATVRRADLAAVGASADEAKISSMLATVAEAEMSAVFTEKLGESDQPQVECSFRAKPGFNVADLAFSFGGGGHAPAAGCTVDGTLTEKVPLIVGRLQEERRRQIGRIQA